MKNKFNTLHQYILDNSINDYHRETVNGLFRSVLEPVISNQKFEAYIVFRLFDLNDKLSVIKRLSFSNIKMYSFTDKFDGIENIEAENIWGKTEFVLVVGARYSACLIWDYDLSDKKDYTPVCYLYNSSILGDIAKKIADNSKIDLKETLLKFNTDRRENRLLNTSISAVASLLNGRNEEIIFSELEKEQLLNSDDKIQTATIVADKARFIAHEIKNNLSVINLYSKIVQKRFENINADLETSSSIENALKNIVNASENISAHINDLRCLSTPFMTEFNVKQSVLTVVEQSFQKAKEANVLINICEFQDKIIKSDRIKFECALMNVIYNAIEACNNGGKIEINCEYEKNNIKVGIKNNGAKIPDEIQDKIFEADFTTKEKGNGLGLAICKKELQIANGDINLIYSNDEETLFEITLIV